MTLSGVVNGPSVFSGISNSARAIPSSTNDNIQLSESNNTSFQGNADFNINGRTVFQDVPITVYLLNGKLVNLSADPVKTGGLFTTPLFGIVTSLTR